MAKIVVDFDKLADAEKKLSVLEAKVANRSLSVNFTNSEGDYTRAIQNQAGMLREMGAELASLIGRTQRAIEKIRLSFKEADESIADAFEKPEG